jgi:hypothetical protein
VKLRVTFLCLAAMLALAACGQGPLAQDAAVIQFEQVGACNGFTSGAVTTSSGPNAAYAVFKIVQIDATKSGVTFSFDPKRLFVTATSPRAFVDNNLQLAQLAGVFRQPASQMPAGKTVQFNGFAFTVVPTATVSGAVEANQTNYFLTYDLAPGDPGITFTKTGRTSWPLTEDCLAIAYK